MDTLARMLRTMRSSFSAMAGGDPARWQEQDLYAQLREALAATRNHSGASGVTTIDKDRNDYVIEAVIQSVTDPTLAPKGLHTLTLGVQQLRKLKIYEGTEHPHGAQNPATLELDDTAAR